MFGDDEGSSWLDEPTEETPAPGAEGAPGAPGAGEDGAPPPKPVERPLARPPPAPVREIETNKRIFTHWSRPTFLQYDYLYRYRHNYYDDWIDYLDRRQRGFEVDPPKPQTWAERALRGYTRDYYPWSPNMPRLSRPSSYSSALLNTPHWANTWHSQHSKDYYNRKYKSILY